MKPLLLMRAANNAKLEVKIVLVTLAVLVMLPVMSVFVVAGSSVSIISSGLNAVVSLFQGPVSTTDLYAYGNCTYWASLMREETGKPIPNTWGNANTWAVNAQLDHYLVDHTPTPTAIMQTAAGDLGHVAYVKSVDASDGSWTISEMNFKGFDLVNERTFTASDAASYNFIHDKAGP